MTQPSRWDLEVIYPSFESEEFAADWRSLKQTVEDMNLMAKDAFEREVDFDAGKTLEQWLHLSENVHRLSSTLGTYINLTIAVDATHDTAVGYASRFGLLLTELTKPSVQFSRWLANQKQIDSLLDSSPFLREHAFLLRTAVEKSRYLLDDDTEDLIGRLRQSGSRAWTELYETMMALHHVDVMNDEGEEERIPLSVVKNSYTSADGPRRSRLHEAEVVSYRGGVERLAASCLNSIKGEVVTMVRRRGYQSPLHATLIDQHMDMTTLEALHAAVEASIPSFGRYFRRKGELLGLAGKPAMWDLPARVGNLCRNFSWDEARDYIVNSFRTFDEELVSMTIRAFDERWIDGKPRSGKQGGAFCAPVKALEQSRILCTYTGTFSDVVTLAHELGHAYHNHCQRERGFLTSGAPMPLAETASVFCETIVAEAARRDASGDDLRALLDASIYEQCRVTLDVYARFLFEDAVFRRREKGVLSPRELNDLMREAQFRVYGNGVRDDGMDVTAWIAKPHYYEAGFSYYNFPYAFGLLFARGLYARFREEGEGFVPQYRKLLAETGRSSVADSAARVGIDVRDELFWRTSLAEIEADIAAFVSMVSDNETV